MKKRKYYVRNYFALITIAFLLSNFLALLVSANSAQSHWTGTTAAGAIITDGTCPVTVENEKLTFDIQEFPKQYYKEINDYLSYSGKLTAEYTLYNPENYTVNATLVFPFGRIPDYGILYDAKTDERILTADTEKYNIMVDGIVIEKTLRHTLSPWGSQFKLNKDMALLHDGYMVDDFYSPDMPVTRYTYVSHNVDTETYDAANAAFILSADPSKTKVLMENQNGGRSLDDAVQLECWVQDEQFIVNVIGEPLGQMPEWKFYENGACEKEIDGTMTLINTEVTTLKDFVLSEYDEKSGILEHDWYNAVIESMKHFEWEYGAIVGSEFQFDIADQLMRWYEYKITLEPGEKIVNTVTAPIYPSFNTNYEPPIYEYTYLLSPAQSWKSFGTLDIMVNTPYHMIEDGLEKFERTDRGYVCHLTGLPKDELTFTLCSEEDPMAPGYNSHFSSSFIMVLAIILIIAVTILFMRRKKHQI